jgi:uncharacterized Fe-S cluster protein YjdI
MKDNEDPCKTDNMGDKIINYGNDQLTVHWKPTLCIHSGICWKELPGVFKPKQRKWVVVEGAPAARVIEQVKKCPSGALSYSVRDNSLAREATTAGLKITVQKDGPLLVDGPVTIEKQGKKIVMEKAALCRCGQSKNKPFCDGSHLSSDFKD